MSIGSGGSARIIMQDADVVVYEYYAYSLNEKKHQNTEHIYDGVITIHRNSLIEPEIHERVKKMPSGRKKLITKRIPKAVDYSKLIEAGQISVKNSNF